MRACSSLDVGVLSFKKSPNFEMPGDRNTDNVYEVTVRASDGTLNADRMVTVKVTDVTENGTVTLSSEEALVGVELTATLADSDGGVSASGQITDESWTWHRGAEDFIVDAETEPNIDEDTSSYTPVTADADAGYLRARVSYTYQFGATKTGISDAIQVLTSRENQAPKFSDGASTFRVVAENAPVDTNEASDDDVGSPVVATDANGDTLIYTLGGSDKDLFEAIVTEGQIEVKDGADLDHETKPRLTVTLTANDGSGTSNATARITVTIYVSDVDEDPVIKDRGDSTAKGERTVEYRENGTGPVATFTVSDPEGASPIVWSLTTETDQEAGVELDDYADNALFDISQSGVLTFEESPSYEPREDDDYRVTVQASDGNEIGYFEVTVDVTNVKEAGKVTWTVTPTGGNAQSLRQFRSGATLMASVTDPDADGDITTTTWKWYRGSTEISGQTAANYTVMDDDVGMHIRVVATYSDGSGGPVESVSFTSETPVQAARLPAEDSAPVFASTMVTRRIAENSTGNVGGPITATDANGDILTYSIPDTADADAALFAINPATGQLMVQLTGTEELNYEDPDDDGENNSYTVAVTARDSFGIATATVAMVTINVFDVDEKPVFQAVATDANVMTDVVAENAPDVELNIATYTATDPEEEEVTLSLVGDDAGLFELDVGVLSFKKSPNFEMPGDRNTDNVYEVTVRASDGTLNADRMVTVKVTDVTENGTVTLSSEEALVGVELTATLADSDGGVSASGQITDESWTWHRGSTAANATTPILGATSSTYTPVTADADAGYVRAMVSYTYQFGADEKTGTSDAIQVLISRENQAPKFSDGASTFRVVAENAPDGDADTADDVGSPVVATDANGDTLIYTLGGSDKDLFEAIVTEGQIEVKAGAKLDHETKPRLTVTLTANDGSGESNATATITVTIYVTDFDEDPTITVSGVTIDLSISGPARASYAENGTGGVATYTLTGTNAASAAWSLEGDDAGDFTISGGMLRFMSSPDYEMPDDANGDNTYMVTVKASYGTDMDTQEVTVTVTDEDDMDDVVMEPSLLERYDTDGDNQISKDEAIAAIDDYLFGVGDEQITKDQVLEVIALYLFG